MVFSTTIVMVCFTITKFFADFFCENQKKKRFKPNQAFKIA